MTPNEAVAQVTESFLVNMTVEHRDPWEFFDWSHNTWGFQQVQALQLRLRDILLQRGAPFADRTQDPVEIVGEVHLAIDTTQLA